MDWCQGVTSMTLFKILFHSVMKVGLQPFWLLRDRLLYAVVRIGIATALKTDDTVFQEECRVTFDCRRIRCFHMLASSRSQRSLQFCFFTDLCLSLWEQHWIQLCFGTLSSENHNLVAGGFFPAVIGYLLLWFGKEAMSTLPLVIKKFRDILSFLLHCSVTEGASWVSAFVLVLCHRESESQSKGTSGLKGALHVCIWVVQH